MIKNYLEELYGVKVNAVNTMIYQGKPKNRIQRSPDWKKAIVTLNEPFTYPKVERPVPKPPKTPTGASTAGSPVQDTATATT